MKTLISLIFLFVILAVALFGGISSLGTIYSVNAGACAYNASGSLVNCSLSNSQYVQQNASATAFSQIFTTLSSSTWILVTAIFIAMMLLFMGLIRRR